MFLSTYNLAIQEQVAHCKWQAEAASTLFFLRHLPTTLVLEGTDDTYSSLDSLSFDTLSDISADTCSEDNVTGCGTSLALSGLADSETMSGVSLASFSSNSPVGSSSHSLSPQSSWSSTTCFLASC
jgi:hypothetical protein